MPGEEIVEILECGHASDYKAMMRWVPVFSVTRSLFATIRVLDPSCPVARKSETFDCEYRLRLKHPSENRPTSLCTRQ